MIRRAAKLAPVHVRPAAMTMLLPFMAALATGLGCGVQELPHDLGALRRLPDGPDEAAIQLGDVTVAKHDAVAFIHFGHSNMAGRAKGPASLHAYFFEETDPHAFMYHAGREPE